MKYRNRIRLRAFSVIEIPIALSILTVGILFLFGAFPSSIDAIGLGRTTLTEAEIAQWQLERIRNLAFGTTSLSTTGSVSFIEKSVINGVTSNTKYLYNITVSPYLSCHSPALSSCSASACPDSSAIQSGGNQATGMDCNSNAMKVATKKSVDILVYETNGSGKLHSITISTEMAR